MCDVCLHALRLSVTLHNTRRLVVVMRGGSRRRVLFALLVGCDEALREDMCDVSHRSHRAVRRSVVSRKRQQRVGNTPAAFGVRPCRHDVKPLSHVKHREMTVTVNLSLIVAMTLTPWVLLGALFRVAWVVFDVLVT